jgi:hypothetical protein
MRLSIHISSRTFLFVWSFIQLTLWPRAVGKASTLAKMFFGATYLNAPSFSLSDSLTLLASCIPSIFPLILAYFCFPCLLTSFSLLNTSLTIVEAIFPRRTRAFPSPIVFWNLTAKKMPLLEVRPDGSLVHVVRDKIERDFQMQDDVSFKLEESGMKTPPFNVQVQRQPEARGVAGAHTGAHGIGRGRGTRFLKPEDRVVGRKAPPDCSRPRLPCETRRPRPTRLWTWGNVMNWYLRLELSMF